MLYIINHKIRWNIVCLRNVEFKQLSMKANALGSQLIYLFFDCYRVKDDFQSVLRTLESFYVFSFVSDKDNTKCKHFATTCMKSKFKVSCQWHYGCEVSYH